MKHFKRSLLVVFSLMVLLLMSISADAAFSVTKNNVKYPTSLTAGSVFIVRGTLSSNMVMKQVTTAICDSTGKKVVEKYTAKVNSLKYDLNNSDSHMHFENLSTGDYYYKIVVKNVNDQKLTVLKKPFTVTPVKMKIEKEKVKLPKTLKAGSNFNISGIITTTLPIKSVVITIYNGDDTKCLQRSTNTVNGKYFNIAEANPKLNFSVLKAGEYYYRISVYNMSGKKKRIVNQKFTVKEPTVASSIKIANPVPAKNIINFPTGKGYVISGTITSANKLTSVKAELIGSNKNVLYTKTVNPGTTTYSLKNSPLDAAMKFDQLPVGIYSFVVSATDSRGKTAVLINRKFYVIAKESKFWMDANYKIVPSSDVTINRGAAYGISGMIRSNLPLTRIQGSLTDTSGRSYYSKTITPTRATTYNLGGSDIDNALHFEKLPAGKYVFTIEVKDSKNSVCPLISRIITVK